MGGTPESDLTVSKFIAFFVKVTNPLEWTRKNRIKSLEPRGANLELADLFTSNVQGQREHCKGQSVQCCVTLRRDSLAADSHSSSTLKPSGTLELTAAVGVRR